MSSRIERPRTGQERVLRAAFRAWSETYYTNTSLAAVARKLGVSKAALYRHFDSKASLVEAMEEAYATDLIETVLVPLEQNPAGELRSFLRDYFTGLSGFYHSRPEYYVFFIIHILKESVLEQPRFRELLERHGELLHRGLAQFEIPA